MVYWKVPQQHAEVIPLVRQGYMRVLCTTSRMIALHLPPGRIIVCLVRAAGCAVYHFIRGKAYPQGNMAKPGDSPSHV
jgi:hypothetical protein